MVTFGSNNALKSKLLKMEEIVRLIEPTVEILFFVRPKINIKATDAEK